LAPDHEEMPLRPAVPPPRLVHERPVRGEPELEHRLARLGVAELRIGPQVPDQKHLVESLGHPRLPCKSLAVSRHYVTTTKHPFRVRQSSRADLECQPPIRVPTRGPC